MGRAEVLRRESFGNLGHRALRAGAGPGPGGPAGDGCAGCPIGPATRHILSGSRGPAVLNVRSAWLTMGRFQGVALTGETIRRASRGRRQRAMEAWRRATRVRGDRRRVRRDRQRGRLLAGAAGGGGRPGDRAVPARSRAGQLAGPFADHSPLVPRPALHRAGRAGLRRCGASSRRSPGFRSSYKTGGLDLERLGTTGLKDLSHCAVSMAERRHSLRGVGRAGGRWTASRSSACRRRRAGCTRPTAVWSMRGKANAVHVALARRHGAVIRDGCPVRAIRPSGDGVEVVTDEGVFAARQVVLAAGAWTNNLLAWPGDRLAADGDAGAGDLFRDAAPARVRARPLPGLDLAGAGRVLRLPDLRRGGDQGGAGRRGRRGDGGDAGRSSRTRAPGSGSSASWRRTSRGSSARSCTPRPASTRCRRTATSSSTRVPGHPRVTVAVDGGHAFKFATLIGRILSELALDGRTEYPIAPFRADRPALTDPTFRPIFRNESASLKSEREAAHDDDCRRLTPRWRIEREELRDG